jgi:cyclin B
LSIAGKYEEIYPPDLKTILRVVNQVVTKEQVLKMEQNILSTLQFSVTFPSANRFIERFGRLA